MKEFKTITFQQDRNQPHDNRWIQVLLLLAIAWLIQYIFEESSIRNAVLILIGIWIFILGFSHYIFKKEKIQGKLGKVLKIGSEGILLDNDLFNYDTIDHIDIYIDGYENQYLASRSRHEKSSGLKNQMIIKVGNRNLSEYFRLATSNTHTI